MMSVFGELSSGNVKFQQAIKIHSSPKQRHVNRIQAAVLK